MIEHGFEAIKLLSDAEPTVGQLFAGGGKDEPQLSTIVSRVGAARLKQVVEDALEGFRRHVQERLARLPRSDAVPDVQVLAAVVARLHESGAQLRLLEIERQVLAQEGKVLDAIYEALRKARQDTAKEALKSIEDRVAQYYFAIHPRDDASEATGAPSIQVQRHGKGTAFVRGQFSGQLVDDPRLVYSDGHLDTVGICIFLALRRLRANQQGDPRLLVLDDIVLSIDLGHARRLITLLRDEFKDHQLIMLTHNGLFASWCKSLMSSLRQIQIRRWTLDSGPILGDHAAASTKLKAAIETGDVKDIALRLMELMDEWLAEARLVYALPVEAKYGGQYTLTDIWNPFVTRVRKVAGKLGSDLGGAILRLDTLKDLPHIRNLSAAHENEIAREIPRSTMVSIATAALELVAALYCSHCNAFVRPLPNPNSPSVAHCPKHHIQYVHDQLAADGAAGSPEDDH